MIKTNVALKEHIPLYNQKKLTIFPCKDKKPLIKFKNLEDQNVDELFNLFNDDHELAIRTGKGLVVIDIDTKELNGMNGFKSFDKLEKEFGKLPETLTVSTRNGGIHLYFKVIDEIELPNHQNLNNAIGVDVRGANGYVIAPPSKDYIFKNIRKIAYLPKLWFDLINKKTPKTELNGTHFKERNDQGQVIDQRDSKARNIIFKALMELTLEKKLTGKDFNENDLADKSYKKFIQECSTKDPDKTLDDEGWTFEKINKKSIYTWNNFLNGDFNNQIEDNYNDSLSFNIDQFEKEMTPIELAESYLSIDNLLAKDFPPLEWVIKDWILKQTISGLYSPAGLGKSTIAQLIATSLSQGKSICSKLQIEKPFRTLYVACEDDKAIFQSRQKNLNSHLGIFEEYKLNNFFLMDRLGKDNRLCNFDANSVPKLTKFYYQLEKIIKEEKIEFLVLDVLQDFFGGNEIIRSDVNYFLKSVLGKLMNDCKVTILVIAHPSLAGQGGHKYSGSTSWRGGFRQMFYIEKKEEEDILILNKFKSNYSKSGDDQNVYFKFHSGCFVPFEKDMQDNNDLITNSPKIRDAIKYYNSTGAILRKRGKLYLSMIKRIENTLNEDMIDKCINHLEHTGQVTYLDKKGYYLTNGVV